MDTMIKNIGDGFHYTGTIRAHRLGGCKLASEKDIRKDEGRLISAESHPAESNPNIIYLR